MTQILITMLAAQSAAAQPSPSPSTQLPLQHIVFVIDNSGSMEEPPAPSDPLRLRGVAASLMLDAAELSSEVQAGLVFFSSEPDPGDAQLHPADKIRQRLQADRLPPAEGSTNMAAGLEDALGILSGSTAPNKRIVLITDGMPDAGQEKKIQEDLVQHAKRAGVQIFALGMSGQVDAAFLEKLTTPTGGKTMVSLQHHKLLEHAKALMGDRDNVFTLAKQALPGSQSEYQFELPPGVDRARVTVILDQPRAFAPDQIEFSLRGPETGDGGRPYIVEVGDGRWVAAWTTFFSTPGKYTLRVAGNAGGGGHQGLRLFVEALSILRVKLTLTPSLDRYTFGDEVKVEVQAATSSGSVDPANLRVSGQVRNSSGGTSTIAFNGAQGLFRVPDVAGRQAVVVKVETSQRLGRAEARVEYEAVPPEPAVLESSRSKIVFTHALGPERMEIEESFKVFAKFPDAVRQRRVTLSATLNSPAGRAELAVRDGGVLRTNGTTSYTVPPEGLDLILRIKMDPTSPSSEKASRKHSGELRFFSSEAGELLVPFHLESRVPRFAIKAEREAFALWWDPRQPRTVDLGRLQTDLSQESTFSVILPEEIHAPNGGPKIASLAMRFGKNTPEPERAEGKLRYGPIPLPPGGQIPLDLIVTPAGETGWEMLAASKQPIEVRLQSSFGMSAAARPTFWNVGAVTLPLLGTRSFHGRHLASAIVLLLGFLIILLLALRRARAIHRFWRFQSGGLQTLRDGTIQIGDVGSGGSAALVLPNSGSELDDRILGRVSLDGKRQRIEDTSGRLLFREKRLSSPQALVPGDRLGITDPQDPAERIWEFDYVDFSPDEGGEIEVVTSPAPWTLKRMFRKLTVSLLILFVLFFLLGRGLMAALAYKLSLVELFYIKFLLS